MLPRLEPRGAVSQSMLYLTPVIAVALTLIAGVILFEALGFDPWKSLYVFFVKPVSTLYGVSELLMKATPLALIALGLAMGFRANVWNIGAEGQLTLGAICGGGIGLCFFEVEGLCILPLMVIASLIGGMIWGAIPAWLKTRFNANEILTSLMLTYVATLLLSALVYGPWKDPQGFGFPQSRMLTDSALLPVIIEGTRLHLGAPIALLVAFAAWIVMTRTVIGFEIKVVGPAPAAAASTRSASSSRAS